MTPFNQGYLDGYMYRDPAHPHDPDYVLGWNQGGSDGIAHNAPPAQRVFDITFEALRDQGRASRDPDNLSCAYRGEGGTKCAVGIWIRDEDYDPKIESRTSSTNEVASRMPAGLAEAHFGLFRNLQQIHDTMPRDRPWTEAELRERFQAGASGYSLSMPE